jgi:hypothetical protein
MDTARRRERSVTRRRWREPASGFDPLTTLASFDSYPMFEAIADAIVTGPTGNNVRDLGILMCAEYLELMQYQNVPNPSLIGGVRNLEPHHLAIA